MAARLEEKGLGLRNCDVDIFYIFIVCEVGLNDSRVVRLGISPTPVSLINSRRPVLEETPTPPAPINRLPVPPPPMPGPAPVPIPLQMPAPGDVPPPPPAAGPTPAPFTRAMPRIVAGGPITLPPGYVLPPGWAVIPAHNVQIVPPPAQIPIGVPNAPVVGQQGLQQGPIPTAVAIPGGHGDVTIPPTIQNQNDNVDQSSGHAARSPASTNIPSSPTTTANNIPPTNMSTTPMQRPAPRVWATQSPHPSFPIAVPLFPTTGNTGVQYRPTTLSPITGRAERTPASTQGSPLSPRVNGVTNTTNEREETESILNQMGESVRAMHDLVTRMSTLIPSQFSTSTSPSIPLENIIPQSIISTPRPIQTNNESHTLDSHGHISDPSSSRTLPSLHLRKRRSFSPVDGANENEPHPSDRLHRLSSSEDDLSPEELADIRAPWVEQAIDIELPLHEGHHSRQGSPPHLRSASQSPTRSLRRRGSLLKHDITNEMLDEKGKGKSSTNMDGGTEGDGLLDKGKGKQVYVEDGSEEE